MASRTDIQAELHREIGAFGADPLGYVRFAFPWSMPGTPLAAESGPETGNAAGRGGAVGLAEAVRLPSPRATAWSALVARIILWALCNDTRGVVAPTPRRSCASLPERRAGLASTATGSPTPHGAAFRAARPRTHLRVDCITWSENNTEAIAGCNKGRRAPSLLDEASSIPTPSGEHRGALTDDGTELFWAAIRRATPAASANASPRRRRWAHRQMTLASVAMTNKAQIAQWAGYGEIPLHPRAARGYLPCRLHAVHLDSEARRPGDRPRADPGSPRPRWSGVGIARQGADRASCASAGLGALIPAVKFRIPT